MTTDTRLWHPWLRINRVLRVMLQTRGSAAWKQVRVEFRRALALTRERSGERAGSTSLVTAPSLRGARLVRVVAFG